MVPATLLLLLRGGGGAAPAYTPADLIDALCLRWQGTPAVASLLAAGEDGTPAVLSDRAARAVPLPYVEVVDPQDSDDAFQSYEDDGTLPGDARGTVQVNVFAGTRRAAKAIVAALKAAVKAEDLTFSEGDLLYLRPTNRGGLALDPDLAPGGGQCWHGLVILDYVIAYAVAP